MNEFHFEETDGFVERWGWKNLHSETICINRTIFGQLMVNGGYDARSFLSWAVRKGIVLGSTVKATGKTIPTKIAKRKGAVMRYVEIRNREYDTEFIEDMDDSSVVI